MTDDAPAPDLVERWAWDYVISTSLETKLLPPPPPARWEHAPPARRLLAPGRPAVLRTARKAEKKRGVGTIRGRARVLHAFFHHELQAAELMLWAVLAFPTSPLEFREGLVRIALDETRHMRLYAGQLERLGHRIGDFAVRDWFWDRVPACPDAASFVAVMGLGLESANLEHSASFAARFRQAGDQESADVQELVGREEIAHVRFGARWFNELSGLAGPTGRGGEVRFETWRRALPPPLSPLLMRGRPLQRDARLRAGFSQRFLDELDAWQIDTPGS